MKKRWVKVAIYILVIPFVVLLSCELGLRAAGYKPENTSEGTSPPLDCGDQFFIPSPTLGIAYHPGAFDCSINGLDFHITIGPDSFRVTGPPSLPDTGKLIYLYGCSMTWGQSLYDTATMAWKLQKWLPGTRIKNYGIGGCGNVQSLLLLKRSIAENKIPAIVVLNYGAFHDERNAMTAQFRQAWHHAFLQSIHPGAHDEYFRMPYARLNKKGELVIKYYTAGQLQYSLPLTRKSAFMNLLNNAVEKMKDRGVDEKKVSAKVIEEMISICRQHHIVFVLAGIWPDKDTKKVITEMQNESICAGDISVDCANDNNFNLLPHDPHPNERANDHYAAGILKLIKPFL